LATAQSEHLSPKEAAAIIGKSPQWLYLRRKLRDGIGPPFRKIGGRIIYVRDELQRWFDSLKMT
jgi:predicted DNA-binding transcriptional regulator AlpA